MITKLKWLFPKYKWQVVYDAGQKHFAIRKLKFFGKIKGMDWSNYRQTPLSPLIVNKEELRKLAEDINFMLEYGDGSKKVNITLIPNEAQKKIMEAKKLDNSQNDSAE